MLHFNEAEREQGHSASDVLYYAFPLLSVLQTVLIQQKVKDVHNQHAGLIVVRGS